MLHCIGVSYKKADVAARGRFSLSSSAQMLLLNRAKEINIEALTVQSTCNRTELYGFCENAQDLVI